MSQPDQAKDQAFLDVFAELVLTVARPMFESFAFDASQSGFPARVDEARDENGNPYIAIRLILRRDAQLDATPEEESLFTFKGLVAERLFEIRADYDRRPGKNGLMEEKVERRMANHVILEDRLTKFLEAAMASRKPPVAQKPLISPVIWKSREGK